MTDLGKKNRGVRMACLLWVVAGLLASMPSHAEPMSVTTEAPADVRLDRPTTGTHVELTADFRPGRSIAAWRERYVLSRQAGFMPVVAPTVASLRIEYADAEAVEIGLRYQESIGSAERDWWNRDEGFVHDLAFAEVTSAEPTDAAGLRHAVAYRTRVPNPRPGHEVTALRISAAGDLADGELTVSEVAVTGGPMAGALRFVAIDGDDAGPGTFDRPWATLRHVAATIEAGDTVYVRGGRYRPTERVLFKNLDAAEGSRTLVSGWPGETAELEFIDVRWNRGPDRISYGFEVMPHDAAMLMAYQCDRFAFHHLTVSHSRSRGIGMDAGYESHQFLEKLDNLGRPPSATDEPMVGSSITHCTVFRSYGPAIRFAHQRDGRVVGNKLIRGVSTTMAPRDANEPDELMGFGEVGRTWLRAQDQTPYFSSRSRRHQRKPPMESLDSGHLVRVEVAYNRIGWNDAEGMLVDGDVDGLRIHHNYVHDAHNRPWVWGIAPNGYGTQRHIEIDHNIAERTGGGIGVGIEGGGSSSHVTLHHNLSIDCFWSGVTFFGGHPPDEGSFHDHTIAHNTVFRCGHLDSNRNPAGGIRLSLTPDQPKRSDPSQTRDVTIDGVRVRHNVIVEPRDYAIGLGRPVDLDALGIVIDGNLTDQPEPSALMGDVDPDRWRAYTGVGLTTADGPLLRDPDANDYRLRAGVGASGDATPGAFGPGAAWVELDGD
jgi:hypothetical protein